MGGDRQKSKHLNKFIQKKTGILFSRTPVFLNISIPLCSIFKPFFAQAHKPTKDQTCLK